MPNYPDFTMTRMAYDRDGSTGFAYNSNNVIRLSTAADLTTCNNENDDLSGYWHESEDSLVFGLIFPQLRDISGFYTCIGSFFAAPTLASVQTSTDTTNGYDGTWTTILSNYTSDVVPVVPNYRQHIQAATATGVKAIRFVHGGGGTQTYTVAALHLYGSYSAGQTPDRLQLWHPTLNQPLDSTPNYLNWGDTPQGSLETRTFRVKNISSTKTANTVTAYLQANTDTSPTVLSQIQLSLDNVNFSISINVADTLAPGAISPVLYCRKWLASTAQPGVWVQRLIATATSFT